MAVVTVEKIKKYLVVKIPLEVAEDRRATIFPRSKRIIDGAIKEGLRDIEAGRTLGPFRNIGEFKRALRKTSVRR